MPRPATSHRCSMRCSRRRCGSAGPHAAYSGLSTVSNVPLRGDARRPAGHYASFAAAMPRGPIRRLQPAHCRGRAARPYPRPVARSTVSRGYPGARAGRNWRHPHLLTVPLLQGRRAARHHLPSTARRSGLHRQADRAAAELRGSGGDRDGERAAADRDSARRWSSRPRPPRCCRSSTPRPAISCRCSTRCWRRPCACAAPRSASC